MQQTSVKTLPTIIVGWPLVGWTVTCAFDRIPGVFIFRVVSTGALKSNGLALARACRLGRRVSELRRLFEYTVEAERQVQNTHNNTNRHLSFLVEA